MPGIPDVLVITWDVKYSQNFDEVLVGSNFVTSRVLGPVGSLVFRMRSACPINIGDFCFLRVCHREYHYVECKMIALLGYKKATQK